MPTQTNIEEDFGFIPATQEANATEDFGFIPVGEESNSPQLNPATPDVKPDINQVKIKSQNIIDMSLDSKMDFQTVREHYDEMLAWKNNKTFNTKKTNTTPFEYPITEYPLDREVISAIKQRSQLKAYDIKNYLVDDPKIETKVTNEIADPDSIPSEQQQSFTAKDKLLMLSIEDLKSVKETAIQNPTLIPFNLRSAASKEIKVREYMDSLKSHSEAKQTAIISGLTFTNVFNAADWTSRKGINPYEVITGTKGAYNIALEAAARVQAEKNDINPVNVSRIANLGAGVLRTALEFWATPGAELTKAPASIRPFLQTGVKFATQNAMNLPTQDETLSQKGMSITESFMMGTGVGAAGKFIPKAQYRVPAMVGGFAGLNYARTGDIESSIETGITVLGFEALGMMQKAQQFTSGRLRNQFATDAIKAARQHNPDLFKFSNQEVGDILNKQATNFADMTQRDLSHKTAREEAKTAWNLKQQGNPDMWNELVKARGFGQGSQKPENIQPNEVFGKGLGKGGALATQSKPAVQTPVTKTNGVVTGNDAAQGNVGGSGIVKQPWEMTRKDWEKQSGVDETVGYHGTAKEDVASILKEGFRDTGEEGVYVGDKDTGEDYAKLRKDDGETPYNLKVRIRNGAKQVGEFIYPYADTIPDHSEFVQQALSENKPVPLNILQEYKGEKWADDAIAKQPISTPQNIVPEQGGGKTAKISEVKKTIKSEVESDPVYQYELDAQDIQGSEVGTGKYFVPKKFKGEVQAAIENDPSLRFYITYDPAKGAAFDTAIQENLLQKTGGSHGNMDISEFLSRLSESNKGRRKIGGISEVLLDKMIASGDPYSEITAVKHTMIHEGFTLNEINEAILEIAVDNDIDAEPLLFKGQTNVKESAGIPKETQGEKGQTPSTSQERQKDLLGREELQGGASGNQGSFLDKENFKTLKAKEQVNAENDIEGQGKVFASPSIAANSVYNEIDAAKLQVELAKVKGTKPISANEILEQARTLFSDIPIRDFATYKKQASGFYDPKYGEIRLKGIEQLTTLFHEIGHFINGRDKVISSNPANDGIARELLTLGEELYGNKQPPGGYESEGWAEFIRLYTTSENAQAKAPETYDWFINKYLPDNPDMANKLNKFKNLILRYRLQGSEERVAQKLKEPSDTFKNIFDRFLLKMETDWLDRFAPIKKYMEEAGISVDPKITRPTENPYFLATVFSDKAGSKAHFFALEGTTDVAGNITGISLQEALAPIANDFDNFEKWSIATKALEDNSKGKNSGISNADAMYIHEKLKSPVFEKALAEWTKWHHRVLQYAVDAGVFTDEEYNRITEKYDVYIPMNRAFKDSEIKQGGGVGGGFSKIGKAVHSKKGSDRPIIHPLQSALRNTERIVSISQKTMVIRALAEYADRPDTARLIKKVPTPLEAVKFSADKIKATVAEHLGIEPSELDGVFDNPDDLITIFSNAQEYLGKNHIIVIKDKTGTRNFYEVEPELFKVLEGLDMYRLPPAVDFLLGKPTRMLRLGATGINLTFGLVRNPIRDIVTATVQSEYNKTPLAAITGIGKDVLNDVAGIAKNFGIKLPTSSDAQLFNALGGTMSSQIMHDKRGQKHLVSTVLASNGKRWTIHTLAHPIDALREITGLTEAGSRIGEFTGALAEGTKLYGKGTPDATLYALQKGQDITTNFTKAGKWGRVLNSFIAFFNAAVQGPNKAYRTAKANPKSFFTKGAIYLTLTSVALWWKNKDKDWYKNLSNYERFDYEHFEITEDLIIRIPRPFELGYLFSSIPVAILDAWYKDNPQEVEDAFRHTLKRTNPFDWPTVLQPIFEVKANQDFAGRPIVPRSEEAKLPEDIFKQRTPEAVKPYLSFLAKGINETFDVKWTPAQIEHIVNSYSGGAYQRTENLMRMSGDEKTASDWPIIGTLFLRESYAPRKQVEDFYKERERLEGTYRSNGENTSTEDISKRETYNEIGLILGDYWGKLASAKTVTEKKEIYGEIEFYIQQANDNNKPQVMQKYNN